MMRKCLKKWELQQDFIYLETIIKHFIRTIYMSYGGWALRLSWRFTSNIPALCLSGHQVVYYDGHLTLSDNNKCARQQAGSAMVVLRSVMATHNN